MRTLGKYRLLEPLASGGMADVFRAEVAGAAGVTKEVALKLVRGEHGASSEFVRMFIQEARLASRLTHANVVQLFEFDEAEGRYYIAMELVRGRNLARVVERCRERGVRLGLARAVHVAAEIAKGLAYAHRIAGPDGAPLGLVHRDVSPQNVLVSFEGEVKIADFGIARALDRQELTAPGTIKGKLTYMAPEQARGEPVDARADVFSLGVVLWELCAGRRLFARDSEPATLAALLGPDPVTPPSEWNEEVPAELDAAILGALEKDPARRTRSADELAQALGRTLLGVARGPEDWDLRALMHRLWPEGDAAPSAAGEATKVKPRAPERAALPSTAASPPAEAPTRTSPAAPRPSASWRRRAAAAAVAIAALTVGAVSLRGDARGGAGATTPTVVSAAPSTSTPTATSEPLDGSAVRPERSAADEAARSRGAAIPAGPADPSPREDGPSRDQSVPTMPARLRSAAGIDTLPLPRAATGEGIVAVNVLPWAVLFVDGVRVGDTPRTVRVPAGRRVLRLEHPKFGSAETTVDVRAGHRHAWRPERLVR